MNSQQSTQRIVFSGRVQGVGFRFTARQTAQRYGVLGWVRNGSDGTVEMLARADSETLNACVQEIVRTMDRYVQQVQRSDWPLAEEFSDFEIRH